MKRYAIYLMVALFIALVLGVWFWLSGERMPTGTAPSSSGTTGDYPHGSAIDWQAWGPQAREQAQRQKRALFVYFHGEWCSWCRQYQAETLEQPETVAAIERDFVPVLVNVDQRRDLFTRLGGRGLPFTVLMDASGKTLARFTGHVSPADLQALLAETATQITTAAAVPRGLEGLLDADPEQFLAFLEETYNPTQQRLSGASIVGTLSKRPQPMTYRLLLYEPEWSERIPGMLDVLREDLYDPVDGGFFFFYDQDNPNPATGVETSKVLGLNAQLIWLFADAYALLGRESDARVVRKSLDYVETHLWEAERRSFWGSQYSNAEYYATPPAERVKRPPPRVERVQYAHVSGQAIIALIRAAKALEEPRYLQWAAIALAGLDENLGHPDGGYYHFRPEGGEAQLAGYLPAQVWPAAAWWMYYANSGDEQAARHGARLLEHIATYYSEELGGFAERLDPAMEPWTESRTHGILAWLLTGPARASRVPDDVLPPTRRAQWMKEALGQLQLISGGDPDDMALGMMAARRWRAADGVP